MTETMDPLVSIDLATRSLRRKRDIWHISEIYSSCQIKSAPTLRLYPRGRAQHARVHVKETALSRFYGNVPTRTRT